jgi:hypothetical protein
MPKPQRMEVIVESDTVIGYLLASRERELATRRWTLMPDEGIAITCWCEKGLNCPANNRLMRPAAKANLASQLLDEIDKFRNLASQLLDEIDKFRREYGLPGKKVKFNRPGAGGKLMSTRRLMLVGLWSSEDALKAAQAAFDRRY